MFIGEKMTHKKFGEGVITDVFITNPLTPDSRITIQFADSIKKFPLTKINDFFTGVSDELSKLCNEAIAEENALKERKMEEIRKALVTLKPCQTNEYNANVTREDWLEAYEVAGNFRWPHESRAVVLDSDMIFINAAAAMRYIGSRPKDGDKLYAACEETKPFLNSNWRYATREDIQINCLDK